MLQFHPLANILPLMDGKEFVEFVASVKQNGLRDPIILYDGMILDGRNRYRACLEIGIDPRTEQFNGRGDPALFVADRNLHRRHLTKSQRALAAAKLVTAQHGTNRFRKKVDGTSSSIYTTTAQIAAAAGIHPMAVKRAKRILAHGTPEEIESVGNGKAFITTVAEKIAAREPRKLSKPRPTGPHHKTLVKRFERHIDLVCTNCEHIEDIEIPKLTDGQIAHACKSLKTARAILGRLVKRIDPKQEDGNGNS